MVLISIAHRAWLISKTGSRIARTMNVDDASHDQQNHRLQERGQRPHGGSRPRRRTSRRCRSARPRCCRTSGRSRSGGTRRAGTGRWSASASAMFSPLCTESRIAFIASAIRLFCMTRWVISMAVITGRPLFIRAPSVRVSRASSSRKSKGPNKGSFRIRRSSRALPSAVLVTGASDSDDRRTRQAEEDDEIRPG